VNDPAAAQAVRFQSDAAGLIERLRALGWRVAAGEGDTGGVLLARLTAEPGSSAAVLGGVVAYDDALKRGCLGVAPEVIVTHGSVSAECALAMAQGVRLLTGAEIGLATTGIAGPGGARPGKPIGLAFVAAVTVERALVRRHVWPHERDGNRHASADAALQLALELLTSDQT
jgi:PncC family amidohydrolase